MSRNRTSIQHEVAIIGGGPAGCAAALALRARGHSVIVISRETQKAKPTETAVPALARLLRSLGAAEALIACEPCHGIVSAWGSPTPTLLPGILNPYGHPWFIHRTRLDARLQQIARDQGAQWINGEAYSLVNDHDGVSISTTREMVRARWAVIAAGSPVSAARLTGQTAVQLDSMIAFWARLATNIEERLLFVEPTNSGWWYLCPADGTGVIACFVTDPATARNLRPSEPARWNDLFSKTDLHRHANEATATAVQVALAGLATLSQLHGPYWVAVGDAAAKLDPLGSSGTATALDSGHCAAQAVADALQGNRIPLEQYGTWTAGVVEEFTRQRRQHYQYEARKQPNEFWSQRLLTAA